MLFFPIDRFGANRVPGMVTFKGRRFEFFFRRLIRLDETFDMEQFTRWRLMEGLDDIGLTLRHTDAIDTYESSRAAWLPSA